MHISIVDVLAADQVLDVRRGLAAARFEDGRRTAGWSAAAVKANEQAAVDPAIETLIDTTVARILAHPVFDLAVRPKRVAKALFSRYQPGHAYGAHVDNALMDGERTDVAFTLFLSDPATYDGGELVIVTSGGDEAVKLPAGCLFAYPATSLHRVAEVTRGERLALVGWVRSYIRSAEQRELLFELETARRTLFDRHGKTAEFDQLAKSCANLMRMWMDD